METVEGEGTAGGDRVGVTSSFIHPFADLYEETQENAYVFGYDAINLRI